MSRTSMLLAAALLLLAGIGAAQPPRITPEMIATSLPLEGAPRAVPGPYEVTSEPAFGAPGYVAFRPADLSAFPGRDSLPVLVWGNGGCAVDSTRYAGFLSTIASHGFLVLGTAAQAGEARRQASADDLRAAIDWAEKENARAGSPLHGKVATEKIAVMGQSCGGFLATALGADPRVTTIGVFNSGVRPANADGTPSRFPTAAALPKLHGPVLLVNGGKRDFMMGASAATFDMIRNVAAFYGSRHNAGHTATVFHPGGGEFANVASSWLMWQFKGDRNAATMFVGEDCGLCKNPDWDVRSKGFDIDPVSLTRLPRLTRADLDAEGKAVYDRIVGDGPVPTTGPVAVSLYSPKIAAAFNDLNGFLRYHGKLSPRLTETAILVATREIEQQYEYSAHEPAALRFGVPQAVVDTIKYDRAPVGLPADETLIIKLGRQLMREHQLDSNLFAEAVQRFGRTGTVELVTVMGDYVMVGMVLTAVDQHLPKDRPALLPPAVP